MYVEIDLDGIICAKRCPLFKDSNGFTDYSAIRQYFIGLGYSVGNYLKIN